MANRRDLKKDIKNMICEVQEECYSHLYYSPEINQEIVLDIISETKDLKKYLLKEVNKNSSSDAKANKEHYKEIVSTLVNGCIDFIERLNSENFSK